MVRPLHHTLSSLFSYSVFVSQFVAISIVLSMAIGALSVAIASGLEGHCSPRTRNDVRLSFATISSFVRRSLEIGLLLMIRRRLLALVLERSDLHLQRSLFFLRIKRNRQSHQTKDNA